MLSQEFYFIVENCISSSGNGREVVGGLNVTYKRFLFRLISALQIMGEKCMTHKW